MNLLEWLAQAVGFVAVATFLLSYQLKKRNRIIIVNATSRILYIVQYIMLGAFEGAALDVFGTVSSIAANNKDRGIIKRHKKLAFIIVNLLIIAVGLLLYEDIFSLFPIAGVLLHTSAFWMTSPKKIRLVSLLGSPFWLVYNFASMAYGSAVGDFLSIVSIMTAIYRYDIRKAKTTEKSDTK